MQAGCVPRLVGAPHVGVLHERGAVVVRGGRAGRRAAAGRHGRHVVARAPAHTD